MADSMWLPADLQAKRLAMQRKQKLAEAMLGSVQAPQAQMVGGQYVAPGILGQAVPLIKVLMGQKLESQATEDTSKFLLENKDRLGAAGSPKDLYKAGKHTLESIGTYKETGNDKDLRDKPAEYDPLSGVTWTTDISSTPDGKEMQRGVTRNGTETWRSVKSGVTVNMGADNAWDKEGTKAVIKQLQTERPLVESATAALSNYQTAKQVLGKGIITGTWADQQTAIRGLFSTVFGYDDSKVASTQEMVATMGNVVMENIRAFGAGTALSDADREYTKVISGASMNIKLQALKNLIAIGEAKAANKVKNYQSMVSSARSSKGADQSIIDALEFRTQIPEGIGAAPGLDGNYVPRLDMLDQPIDGADQPVVPAPIEDLRQQFNKIIRKQP